jgi:hypothetical protein
MVGMVYAIIGTSGLFLDDLSKADLAMTMTTKMED